MNIKLKLTFLILLCSLSAISKTESITESPEKKEIEILKLKLDVLEEKIEYQNNQINSQAGMLDTAFDGVSTELGASSNYISVASFILAILSIGLGWYVTKIEKSIKEMANDSETLMQKNIEIKKSIESLSEKITKDSKGLYKIIRDEESNHLLDRLISVPEDIINLFKSIASRDLENEHFFKLKEAYLQVKEDAEYNKSYLYLLFQHFSGLSFLDEDIRINFIKIMDEAFENSFKNDAIKSSKDFFDTIAELDITNYKSEINSFIKGICKSKFSQNEGIYFEINNSIKTRDLKFKLYETIEIIPETITFRKKFGKLILEYEYDNLSEEERIIIEKITNLI
jgi:hypothetical protein